MRRRASSVSVGTVGKMVVMGPPPPPPGLLGGFSEMGGGLAAGNLAAFQGRGPQIGGGSRGLPAFESQRQRQGSSWAVDPSLLVNSSSMAGMQGVLGGGKGSDLPLRHQRREKPVRA